jgi:8-hydroxy-5-deazaflavin:NADPH oxidoreductase
MKKIAIIGKGNVGKNLGATLSRAGHEVTFGERDATGSSVARAVKSADIVFLAVPAEAAVSALGPAGDLTGKILVDCTNPIGWSDGPVRAAPPEGSNAALLQARFPRARVVKGFNTFPAEVHGRPDIGGRSVDVLLAGDDVAAKQAISEVALSAGFVPRDAGPLRNAAHLESVAILVIHMGVAGGLGRRITFDLDVREEPTERPTWPHGEVVETSEAPGFAPPGGEGFFLRPLVEREGQFPSLVLGTLAPGGSIPREIHEAAREHLLVLDGEVVYAADSGEHVTIRAGQMMRLAANTWHKVRNEARRPARFLVAPG